MGPVARNVGMLSVGFVTAAVFAGCASAPTPSSTPAAMTAAEQAVSATFEEYIKVQNAEVAAGRLDKSLAVIAEKATIDSIVAGGKVAKPQFAAAMAKFLETPANRGFRSEFRVDKVSFSDPTHATVEARGITYRAGSFTQGAWSAARRVEWRFEERDGKWWIVETAYR